MVSGMPPTPRRHHRNSSPSAALATLLSTARHQAGLSQQQLADRAGVERTTVIRFESGTAARPEGATLRLLCTALDIRYLDALVALSAVSSEDIQTHPVRRTPVAA